MTQLDRYLDRTWARAGVPLDSRDDCTQAVYARLLQSFGRECFDIFLSGVNTSGITLSRDTREGLEFFRAIDMVKKRAYREPRHQPINYADNVCGNTHASPFDWSAMLHDVIDKTLNPQEMRLVSATLRGETPAEIAQKWGVAPKTVSNEKSRVIQKLRVALQDVHETR